MKGKYLMAFIMISLIDVLFITGFNAMSKLEISLNEVYSPKVIELISSQELEESIPISFISADRIRIKNRETSIDSLEFFLQEYDPKVINLKLLTAQTSYLSVTRILESKNIDVFIPITE